MVMDKQAIRRIFFLVTFLFGSVSIWKLFASAIALSDAGDFAYSAVLFSILSVWWFVGAVTLSSPLDRFLTSAVAFLPGALFFGFGYLIPAAVSVLFGWLSLRAVARETDERLRYSFSRNAGAGTGKFLFALCLTIVSGYYFTIRVQSPEEIMPRFSLAGGTGGVILKWMGAIHPAFRTLSQEGTTVDGFLSDMRETNGDDGLSMVPSEVVRTAPDGKPVHVTLTAAERQKLLDTQRPAIDQQFFRSGEDQISGLVGRAVSGNEKMADVLSEILNQKIFALLSANDRGTMSVQVLPFFLAVLLFVTLLSVGAILIPIWVTFASGIFFLLIATGAFRITRVPAEREILR
jgi:hypothetical protein